jgi:hypothetical protein
MSKFSDDDDNLANFIRQYRPEVPPVSPNLENKILQDVEKLHIVSLPPKRQHYRWRKMFILGAIASGLLAVIFGYRALIPATPSPAELASLENFMESNWQGAVGNAASEEFNCCQNIVYETLAPIDDQ